MPIKFEVVPNDEYWNKVAESGQRAVLRYYGGYYMAMLEYLGDSIWDEGWDDLTVDDASYEALQWVRDDDFCADILGEDLETAIYSIPLVEGTTITVLFRIFDEEINTCYGVEYDYHIDVDLFQVQQPRDWLEKAIEYCIEEGGVLIDGDNLR